MAKRELLATMRDHYRALPKNDKISVSERNPEIAGPSTHDSEFCVGETKCKAKNPTFT